MGEYLKKIQNYDNYASRLLFDLKNYNSVQKSIILQDSAAGFAQKSVPFVLI
jgi:phosphotransferase system IIB component